ncbi:hypothetical protein [Rhizobium leguminosarum]|uniref:hypothetical protein n=1 Tax=Rhizobium leguminosarum TaxID=384 RepID=UPI001FE1E9D8|nr:hypothetical protein [Rhizobium leguminosarum]
MTNDEAMTKNIAFPRMAILVAFSVAGGLLFWLTSSPIGLLLPIGVGTPLQSERRVYYLLDLVHRTAVGISRSIGQSHWDPAYFGLVGNISCGGFGMHLRSRLQPSETRSFPYRRWLAVCRRTTPTWPNRAILELGSS